MALHRNGKRRRDCVWRPRPLLHRNECENPVALQLGGSEPELLAKASAKATEYGYDEINLNCGCPSPHVQKGAFGACLMNEVELVSNCLNAMQDAAPDCAVTIKHRIGLDKQTEYEPLAEFVGTLRDKTPAALSSSMHATHG